MRIEKNPSSSLRDHLKHLALALPLSAAVFLGTGQVMAQSGISYSGPAAGAWNDGANWQGGVVPTGGNQPLVDIAGPVISASNTVSINGGFYIGISGGPGSVSQTGGSMTVNNMEPGYGAHQGTYTLSGGTLNLVQGGWTLLLGRNGNGTFNLEGGTLNSGQIWMGWSGGTGVFNMTGGTLNSNYAGSAFQWTNGQVNFGGGDMYLKGDQTAIGNNAWFHKTGEGNFTATYDTPTDTTHLYYTPPTSSDKDIITFIFPTYGPATIVGTAITLTVPLGTDVTALEPSYTVSVGASCVPDSGLPLDFTNPVHYIVTAEDSSTKDYTVTVNRIPVMLTFGPGATITGTNIVWTVPQGTNVTALSPTCTISDGASCLPASGSTQDFTNPVHYVVSATGFSSQDYTVTVNQAAQNITYIGAADGAWNSPANWAGGFVPSGPNKPVVDSIGPVISASDTVSLSSGFYVGAFGGPASVSQTGGSVTAGNLEPGFAAQGTYTLSGGTLTLTDTGWDLLIGRGASGTFNLAGGTLTSAGQIWLGFSGGTGVFNMTGGTLVSNFAGNAFQFTQGDFNFSGGDIYLKGDQTAIVGNSWFHKTGTGTYTETYDAPTDTTHLSFVSSDPFALWINGLDWSAFTSPDITATGDPDGDGMSNQQEFAFGLDPRHGSSVNPITVPLDKSTGSFSYTRGSTTGLTYTVITSTDLKTWTPDTGALQTPGTAINGVETVEVQLSILELLTAPSVFVRVAAQ